MAAMADANAGGFAIREQSAYGQGSSFAGIAAGGSLSSMFWNPATMTQFAGSGFEGVVSVIMPDATQNYTSSTLATGLGPVIPAYATGVDNSGDTAAVPATYSSIQINDKLWLGMSVNAPFGLGVGFPVQWAGAGYGQDSKVESYNFTPSVAYKFNDMISVAAGVQVQYMKVSYSVGLPPSGNTAVISGAGYAYGFTLGATITPTPTTTIGIGYRSALDQDIDGTLSSPVGGSSVGSVSTSLALPDMLTVGLRQKIGDRFTLLAGFEWAGWSRIGTSTVTTPTGATATIGGAPVTLPFQYSDSYFYSLGGEYMLNESVMLRAGIAFEQSPITDDVRTPRLPDNDRWWYSVGASYKVPEVKGLIFDIGYSYIDVADTPIDISAASGNPWLNGTGTYIGSTESHIHILSFGVKYRWGGHAPVKTALVTK